MNVSGIANTLYPVGLALANIGLGVGLYERELLLLALILWLTGALVLVGFLSALKQGRNRPGGTPLDSETI